jgi:hypothetical protein
VFTEQCVSETKPNLPSWKSKEEKQEEKRKQKERKEKHMLCYKKDS